MEVGAVADWYRTKLERLVKSVEATAQAEGKSSSRNGADEGGFPGGDKKVRKGATEDFCGGKSGEVTSSAGEGVLTDGMAVRGCAGVLRKRVSEKEDEEVFMGEKKGAITMSLDGDNGHAANCSVEESLGRASEDALERAFEEYMKEENGGFQEEETQNPNLDSAGGFWKKETDGFQKRSTRETRKVATTREFEFEEVLLGQNEVILEGTIGDRHEWADGVEKLSTATIEEAMEEASPKGAQKASEVISRGNDDKYSKFAAEGTREKASAECLKEGAVDAARGWRENGLTGSANGTVFPGSSDTGLKEASGIIGHGEDDLLRQKLKDAVDETRKEASESGPEGAAAMGGSRDVLDGAGPEQIGGVLKKPDEGSGGEATQNLRDAVERSLEEARESVLAGGAEGAANGSSNGVVGALPLGVSGGDSNGARAVSRKDQGTSDVSRKEDADSHGSGNGLGWRDSGVSKGMQSPRKEPAGQEAVVGSQGVEEQESLGGSGPLGCKEGAPQVCNQRAEEDAKGGLHEESAEGADQDGDNVPIAELCVFERPAERLSAENVNKGGVEKGNGQTGAVRNAEDRGGVGGKSGSLDAEADSVLLASWTREHGQVAAQPQRAKKQCTGVLLQNVCALANAPREQKEAALERLNRDGKRRRALDGLDARGALALLEAVEQAAVMHLVASARAGRVEVGRNEYGRESKVMPTGWYDEVVDQTGMREAVWGRQVLGDDGEGEI
jgi:hypothetical protein